MLTLVILEGLVIAVLGVLVVGLLRSHAEILRRLHELGAGVYDEEAPTDGVTSTIELTERPDIRTREGVPEPREVAAVGGHDVSGVTPTGNGKAVGVVGRRTLHVAGVPLERLRNLRRLLARVRRAVRPTRCRDATRAS